MYWKINKLFRKYEVFVIYNVQPIDYLNDELITLRR